MSVIGEYAVRSEDLALGATLRTVSGVELDVERAYATDPTKPILFVWATVPDVAAFDAALESDPTVGEFEVLSEVDGDRLYRIATTDQIGVALYPAWVELGAERLEARYADGWWHARTRFPDREALSAYRQYLQDNDVEFRLERLYGSTKRENGDRALTDEQRETLELAYEVGYFDVPRSATTTDLAAELGVSNQAVSERLRRGYARLVEETID
jgi:predicted DNA binding protein